MQFVAIDVETANPSYASICQIGTVVFDDRNDPQILTSYVNPEEDFHPANIAIHGITERHVRSAPTFPELHEQLQEILTGQIAVCHTHFDRVAVHQACEKYGLPDIDCRWLDTARVVRRTWGQFAERGYSLPNIADHLGIEYLAHDAGQDAWAAGQVLLRAVDEAQISIEDWVKRSRVPARYVRPSASSLPEPNPEGHLAGEVIVFTGSLVIPRPKAQQIAAEAGCQIAKNVTKKTTILVVGDQDLRYLAGHEKSSKHRKAERYREEGQELRIIGEKDFEALVDVDLLTYKGPGLSGEAQQLTGGSSTTPIAVISESSERKRNKYTPILIAIGVLILAFVLCGIIGLLFGESTMPLPIF